MNFNLFFLCSFLIYNICNCQDYKILYKMSYRADSLSEFVFQKDMILDINSKNTSFSSYKMYQSDSAYAKDKILGKDNLNRFIDYDFMIIKNKEKKIIKKYYKFSIFNGVYTLKEEYPLFNWKVSKQTKEINGYFCQKAELNYKGRYWEAWFTQDILLQEGPYIFHGLPGLIIKMKDNKENYIFEMIGIQKNTIIDNIDIKDSFKKELVVNKKQLNKLYIDYYNDPYKEVRAQGSIIENNESLNLNERTIKKQKAIKKYNNPIELSEAIHFP